MKQNFSSSSNKIKITLVSIGLAILLVILGYLIGLLLRQSGFRLSMLVPQSWGPLDLPPTSIVQTVVIPTPDCDPPTLVLGTETLQIQMITPAADGSLTVPLDTSGIAYWVEGTSTNYAFVLSPTEENIALMSTLTVGSTATATWSNCDSTTYNLSAGPQQSTLGAVAATDPSKEGILVFFETDPSGAGLAFLGNLAEQVEAVIDTPQPDESGVLAEISLLETNPSPDGTTIKVSVSIRNYGQTTFTVSSDDVSLTQPDGAVLSLENSRPRLPEGIRPGVTKTFELTFSRPTSPAATLKIFTVEYDIEGY